MPHFVLFFLLAIIVPFSYHYRSSTIAIAHLFIFSILTPIFKICIRQPGSPIFKQFNLHLVVSEKNLLLFVNKVRCPTLSFFSSWRLLCLFHIIIVVALSQSLICLFSRSHPSTRPHLSLSWFTS